MTTSECRIEMMGSLRVLRGEQETTRFRTRKTGALLAYLAAFPDRPARREELIEIFWPDNDIDSGRNCLRIALSALKQMLASPVPAAPIYAAFQSDQHVAQARFQSSAAISSSASASAADLPGSNSILIADRVTARLDPAAFTTDMVEFDTSIRCAAGASTIPQRIGWLKRAIALYEGDLLPGYDEEWVVSARGRLAASWQVALRQLAALLVKTGDIAGAMNYAHRSVIADPLCEESHRMLIQLYSGLDQRDAALRQYQSLERLLAENLRATPNNKTRALIEGMGSEGMEMRDAQAAYSASSAAATLTDSGPIANISPASPAPAFPRYNPAPAVREGSLPAPYSRFFGREDSLAHVLEMVDTPHTRLITLTGLGGSGKTRLAVQVGAKLREPMQGAVWFVPLAAVSDPQRILDAVAELVSPAPPASLSSHERIVRALSSAPALLILDNFEHLAEQGALLIPPLLDALPDLICLVTSRQRLNLTGEYEYAVLPLPTPQSAGTPDRLLEFASVQLFVDRAKAARSEFALTRDNAPAIAALCHHLEGVPLAIELAAAFAQVLTPAQILARASRRLPLLVSRSKDSPARHASLRAALDWSWQLLNPDLQRAFTRLSVLRGGWTLDAANVIVADKPADTPDGDADAFSTFDAGPFGAFFAGSAAPQGWAQEPPQNTPDVLQSLAELRERSLIQAEETGPEMRYQMLETLREFALEQMDGQEARDARRRHSLFFLQLAENAEPHLTGTGAGAWLKRLYADRDNLRSALHFLLAAPPNSASIAESGLLSQPGEPPAEPTSQSALRLAAALWRFWYVRGCYDEGQEWLQKALAADNAQHCPASVRLKALRGLGNLALAQGHLGRAEAAFEEHNTLANDAGSLVDRAAALGSLAHIRREQADLSGARALYEDSLRLFRQADDERGIALTLANMAVVMIADSQHIAAIETARESLNLFRQFNDTENVVLALNNMAVALIGVGRVADARDCLIESLNAAHAQDNRRGFVLALNTLIYLVGRDGEIRHAAVLLGYAEMLQQQIHLPAESMLYAEFKREYERVRSSMGAREFDQRAAGAHALSLEQILEIAHDLPA